ncbi:MAG: ABC transporter substrate-binding protein [Cryobacterium sp.]|nr:ABC transporter substrate-binding protein [Cryobacterium sp.]
MPSNVRSRSILFIVAALLLAACSSGGQQQDPAAVGDTDTLKIAFFADMSTADPDVFYDIEGLAVMHAVYEGLLRYAPGGTEIEGDLAESWEVSEDGLTFTFTLKNDLTYADGTPLDSESLKASFERRTAVEQGPSYMLGGVASYETPDPQTIIINLTDPDSAFLHYLASAWGPKAVNPTVLEENSDDLAQKYLETNSAGSGPYVIEEFTRGTGYTLKRNDNYWGEAPAFETVEVAITPDISSQTLALESGDLDLIPHGFPLSNLPSVESNNDLTVEEFTSLGTTSLYLNQNKDSLADVDTREALMRALDIPSLVEDVYGDTATVPSNAYPEGLLDPSLATVDYATGDSAALSDQNISLDIVYTPDSSGVQRRLADLMRQRLATVGVDSTPRQAQLGEVFGYREDVQNAADIYVSTPAPDGAHPDTWGRIVWYTEGPLNFFNYTNPEVDAALDRGLVEVDPDAASEAYAEAGELATQDWSVVPIAYVSDVVVARADLSGIEHTPAYPWTVDLAELDR